MSAASEVRGKVHYEPASAEEQMKRKANDFIDDGAKFCKEASKDASLKAGYAFLYAFVIFLRNYLVPEWICKRIENYKIEPIVERCAAVTNPSIDKTADLSKKAFTKSAEVSKNYAPSLYNRCISCN
jgi:hypothetical protein